VIEADAVTLAVSHVGAATVGAFVYVLLQERDARQGPICPVCLGGTRDDGTAENH